jgi:hypothetical protein
MPTPLFGWRPVRPAELIATTLTLEGDLVMNFWVKFAALLLVVSNCLVYAGRSVGINTGLILSKSTFGISYTDGKSELNFGMKSHPLDLDPSSNQIFQPGITINRYLGTSGFYGSLTYAPVLINIEEFNDFDVHGVSKREPIFGHRYFMKDGWNSGEVFFGLGKSFQFIHWGIHLDGNLISPATGKFGQSWFYQLGAGFSYRFNLD